MSNSEHLNQLSSGKSLERRGMIRKTVKPYVKGTAPARRPAASPKRSEYLLFSPIHYEPKYAYPLLVWFHSPGADETEIFRVMPQMSLRNYVAVAPRGLTPEETGSRRVDRFRSLEGNVGRFAALYDWTETAATLDRAETRVFEAIDRARLRCHLAPNRIFLAGIGAGGSMAMRLGARYPERFAGVISFSGGFPMIPSSLSKWEALRRLPMVMMIGSKNPVFSPAAVSKQLRLFHTAGMSVSIRQYHTADDTAPQMFRDANQWIMEQVTQPSA
ncbi:MAG: hypothetical protein IJJ20_04380 [Thermoguttaceae bacterium]|nr:hypothetical protein [Thermoguttaceae bacterium]